MKFLDFMRPKRVKLKLRYESLSSFEKGFEGEEILFIERGLIEV